MVSRWPESLLEPGLANQRITIWAMPVVVNHPFPHQHPSPSTPTPNPLFTWSCWACSLLWWWWMCYWVPLSITVAMPSWHFSLCLLVTDFRTSELEGILIISPLPYEWGTENPGCLIQVQVSLHQFMVFFSVYEKIITTTPYRSPILSACHASCHLFLVTTVWGRC